MRYIILFLLSFFVSGLFAQTIQFSKLKAKSGGQIEMDGYSIFGFSNDPTLADSSTIELVTEAAAKAYTDTKGRVDSLVLSQDSILIGYDSGGNELSRDTISTLTGVSVAPTGVYRGLIEILEDSLGLDINGLTSPLAITGNDAFLMYDDGGVTNAKVLWDSIVGQVRDSADWVIDYTGIFANISPRFAGSIIKTRGYWQAGDGGGANYIVESSGSADNIRIFATANGMYARLIANEDGSISPLQLGAVLDDGVDDRLRIQAALTNFDWVKCHKVGQFLSNDSLIVKSNQIIDFGRSLIIRSESSTNHMMLTTQGSVFTLQLDSNIIIQGGIWDANNPTGSGRTGGATQASLYGFALFNIQNLIVRDVKIITCNKYAIGAGQLTNPVFSNITFNTDSDGLHVEGPSTDIMIDGIFGNTGDDFVAISGRNYTSNDFTQGDISNLIIRNIYSSSSSSDGNIIALFPGNDSLGTPGTYNNYRFKNVHIENVGGHSTNADIISIDDYGTAGNATNGSSVGGVIDGLTIKNISGIPGSQFLISMGIDTIKNLVIDGVFPDTNLAKIQIDGTCVVENAKWSNLRFKGNNASPVINVTNSAKFNNLEIENMSAKLSSTGTRFIQLESDSVGGILTLRNVDFRKAPKDAAGAVYVNTDSMQINVESSYFEGMVYAMQVNSTNVVVRITDTKYRNAARAVADASASASITVYPNSYDFQYDGIGQQFAFDEVNAGTITLAHPSDNIGGYITTAIAYAIPANYPTGTWKYIYNSSAAAVAITASGGLINSAASFSLGSLAGSWFKKTSATDWSTSVGGSIGAGTLGQTLYNNGSSWLPSSNVYHDGTNVGIGTTTPLSWKLNVNGAISTLTGLYKWSTGESFLDYQSTNGNLFGNWTTLGSANRLDVGVSSSFNTWWRSSGNIGIHTSTMTEALNVAGSIQVMGDFGLIVDSLGDNRLGIMKYANFQPYFVHGNTIPLVFGQVNQRSVKGGTFSKQLQISTTGLVGIGSNTPYHLLSSYGSNPVWALTDTDVNINVSSAAQAIDTSAISIDLSGAPTIKFAGTDGDAMQFATTTSDALSVTGASGGLLVDSKMMIGGSTSPLQSLEVLSASHAYVVARTSHAGLNAGVILENSGDAADSYLIRRDSVGTFTMAYSAAQPSGTDIPFLVFDKSDSTLQAGFSNIDLQLVAKVQDEDGDAGTSGQTLVATSTGTNWISSANGEIFIDRTDPDTITYTSGSTVADSLNDFTIADDTLNFTVVGSSLKYIGVDTARFDVTISASFSFSEADDIYGDLYVDTGSGLGRSLKIGFVRTISNVDPDVGSSTASGTLLLAPNDRVNFLFEPGAHTGDDDLIIYKFNMKLHKE